MALGTYNLDLIDIFSFWHHIGFVDIDGVLECVWDIFERENHSGNFRRDFGLQVELRPTAAVRLLDWRVLDFENECVMDY